MLDSTKPMRVGIEGVSYSLTHVPDLVRFGSKPLRELRAQPALSADLAKRLRDLPQPWYEKLIEGATAQGRFGDLVDQNKFYALLAGADQFNLVSFEEEWFQAHAAAHSIGRAPRLKPLSEIQNLCDKGALPLYSGAQLVGVMRRCGLRSLTRRP